MLCRTCRTRWFSHPRGPDPCPLVLMPGATSLQAHFLNTNHQCRSLTLAYHSSFMNCKGMIPQWALSVCNINLWSVEQSWKLDASVWCFRRRTVSALLVTPTYTRWRYIWNTRYTAYWGGVTLVYQTWTWLNLRAILSAACVLYGR